MSRSKTESYHHGDLRAAVLEAARALVEEAGVEALTLREVARRAGVSSAAPYHHFKDKAELVRELALQSLEDLDRASREAMAGKTSPAEKLQAIGIAYVMYAVENPGAFRLMFRPEMGSPFESPQPECRPVFDLLREVIGAFPAAHETGAAEFAAIAAWSLVHGLAALLVDGPLHPMTADRERVRTLVTALTTISPWPTVPVTR